MRRGGEGRTISVAGAVEWRAAQDTECAGVGGVQRVSVAGRTIPVRGAVVAGRAAAAATLGCFRAVADSMTRVAAVVAELVGRWSWTPVGVGTEGKGDGADSNGDKSVQGVARGCLRVREVEDEFA